MSKVRLSKLQKKILVTLLSGEMPSDKHPGKVGFVRVMGRSALAFKVFNWQGHNRYKENNRIATLRNKWVDWKRRLDYPQGYNKKQATLTRSLQLLAGNGYVWLLDCFEMPISIYSKTASKRVKVKRRNFKKEREEAIRESREKFKKELKESEYMQKHKYTFDDWFDAPMINAFGGRTTKRKVFESWYSKRSCRNAVKVGLTKKGLSKAKEYLKVNSRTALPDLTLRRHIYYQNK